MDLFSLVQGKVKDDSGRLSGETDYLPAISAALERYSEARPLVAVADLTGNGSTDLDLPAAWDPDFSRIRAVEYPVGRVPAALFAPESCQLYQDPDGVKLRLLLDHERLRLRLVTLPAEGVPVRLTFTLPRDESTLLRGDLDAVANLAAAICSETLASLFAQTSDPTISADAVNYRTKSAEFAARAKRFRQLYLDHVGISGDNGPVASMVMATPPPAGRTRLTH